MTLYQIDEALTACIDPETGEVDAERYEALSMERDRKIEGIGCLYKNYLSDITALKAEKATFEERIKSLESKADRLKSYLTSALDGETYNSARLVVKYTKSKSTIIDDMTVLPAEYLIPTEPKADKVAIKAAILAGENIPGAHIENKQNIQIK